MLGELIHYEPEFAFSTFFPNAYSDTNIAIPFCISFAWKSFIYVFIFNLTDGKISVFYREMCWNCKPV